jgi:hypothetical protein
VHRAPSTLNSLALPPFIYAAMSNGAVEQTSTTGGYSSTAVWRGRETLYLTMIGESNEEAVRALTDRCRHLIVGAPSTACIVVIDTTQVLRLAVSPAFMGACREFLAFLKLQGTTLIVGVSNNNAIRSVASAVGFGVGVRLLITPTLDAALALADREAARVA